MKAWVSAMLPSLGMAPRARERERRKGRIWHHQATTTHRPALHRALACEPQLVNPRHLGSLHASHGSGRIAAKRVSSKHASHSGCAANEDPYPIGECFIRPERSTCGRQKRARWRGGEANRNQRHSPHRMSCAGWPHHARSRFVQRSTPSVRTASGVCSHETYRWANRCSRPCTPCEICCPRIALG